MILSTYVPLVEMLDEHRRVGWRLLTDLGIPSRLFDDAQRRRLRHARRLRLLGRRVPDRGDCVPPLTILWRIAEDARITDEVDELLRGRRRFGDIRQAILTVLSRYI